MSSEACRYVGLLFSLDILFGGRADSNAVGPKLKHMQRKTVPAPIDILFYPLLEI
jgi:hypothetical protein